MPFLQSLALWLQVGQEDILSSHPRPPKLNPFQGPGRCWSIQGLSQPSPRLFFSFCSLLGLLQCLKCRQALISGHETQKLQSLVLFACIVALLTESQHEQTHMGLCTATQNFKKRALGCCCVLQVKASGVICTSTGINAVFWPASECSGAVRCDLVQSSRLHASGHIHAACQAHHPGLVCWPWSIHCHGRMLA